MMYEKKDMCYDIVRDGKKLVTIITLLQKIKRQKTKMRFFDFTFKCIITIY